VINRAGIAGAINVESSRLDAFTAEDETILQIVANQVGVALDNAELLHAARSEVAERRRAEQALRDSEQRYRGLFDSNPHPMWVYDCETQAFLAVNDAAVSRYGYSREEFLAMTLRDIRPADDVPLLERHLSTIASGYSGPEVWRHRLKDGRIIEVEISAQLIRFAGRNARFVLAHDVTQKRIAEAEQRLHSAVFESTHDGYCMQRYDNRRFDSAARIMRPVAAVFVHPRSRGR